MRSMENIVKDEAFHFIAALKRNTNTPYNIKPLLQKAVTNVVSGVTLGERFNHDDARFEGLVKSMGILAQYSGLTNPASLVSALRVIPGDPFKYHQVSRTSIWTNSIMIYHDIMHNILVGIW